MTDYEQWKEWLDKWNISYGEREYSFSKELTVGGYYCATVIEFDTSGRFLDMTAYE